MQKKHIVFGILLLLSVLVSGCSSQQPTQPEENITPVITENVTPIEDENASANIVETNLTVENVSDSDLKILINDSN